MPQEIIADRYAIMPDAPPLMGGHSTLHKAVDMRTADVVAVKMLAVPDDRVEQLVFERETASMRAVSHDNIVRLLDSGKIDDPLTAYLVFPWYEMNLFEYLQQSGPINWGDFWPRIGRPLLQAVSALHSEDIEHRDIKPQNVLMNKEGHPFLSDFGIAKLRESAASDAGLTLNAYRSGAYAPPEIECSQRFVRDVYGMAALIVRCVSGKSFGDRDALLEVFDGAVFPGDVKEILRSALESNPEDRQRNALELHNALRSAVMDGVNQQRSGRYHVRLALTNRAREMVAEAKGVSAIAAEGVLRRDLDGQVFAEYTRDNETEAIQRDYVRLHGESWTLGVKLKGDEWLGLVTAAYQSPLDVLDRSRNRSYEMSKVSFGFSSHPSNQEAFEYLLNQLDECTEKDRLTFSEEDSHGDKYLDIWERMLNAREQVMVQARNNLRFDEVVARSSRELRVRIQTEGPLDSADFLGGEYELRSPIGGQRPFARGELIGLSPEMEKGDFEATFRANRDLPREVPTPGLLTPYEGGTQNSLKRQRDALSSVRHGVGAGAHLKSVITDPKSSPLPAARTPASWMQPMDDDKQDVVRAALGNDGVLTVQGPPGTGKTRLITETVWQRLDLNPSECILLVSQSHVAVDNALQRLKELGLTGLVRLGRAGDPKISADTVDLLLENQLDGWADSIAGTAKKHFSDLAQGQGVEARHVAAAVKLHQLARCMSDRVRMSEALRESDEREPGAVSTLAVSNMIETSAHLKEEESSLRVEIDVLLDGDLTSDSLVDLESVAAAIDLLLPQGEDSDRLINLLRLQSDWLRRLKSDTTLAAAYLKTAKVVAGTCIGFIGQPGVQSIDFDTCIVDEASRATSTELLVPMSKAQRWVLVGDTRQLPPDDEELLRDRGVLEANHLTADEVSNNLFEYFSEALPTECRHDLRTQYRMIAPIGDMISECFYEGRLDSPRRHGVKGYDLLGKPVLWLDTSRIGDKRREERDANRSLFNREEMRLVLDRLRSLSTAVGKGIIANPSNGDFHVLLIAPYSAQVASLRSQTRGKTYAGLSVEVLTVDAVQGREADFAIFSVTRSNVRSDFGFISEAYWRRINVALSRGRFGLTIVGDASFCRSRPNALRSVLNYISQHPDECELRDVRA